MVSVIVAFPRMEDARAIRSLLLKYSFTVAGMYTSGAQVLQRADDLGDCIVVCGYQLADMPFQSLQESLPEYCSMLLLTAKPVWDECHVRGICCLPMPLKPRQFIETVGSLADQMMELRRKRKSRPRQRSQEENSVIARAKELLQKVNHWSEEEAHRYLQRCSMDSGSSLVETAYMVFSMYDNE